jgi:hypothetical protein
MIHRITIPRMDDELIARSPIIETVAVNGDITYHGVYLQDRETMWVKIEQVTQDEIMLAEHTFVRQQDPVKKGWHMSCCISTTCWVLTLLISCHRNGTYSLYPE